MSGKMDWQYFGNDTFSSTNIIVGK